MSDATRRMIDEEQQYITDLAHRRAMELVSKNRTLLEAFAFTLLENEVLERDDIERIVGNYLGERNGRPEPVDTREPARLAASEGIEPQGPDQRKG
jgi:hypothetical protein